MEQMNKVVRLDEDPVRNEEKVEVGDGGGSENDLSYMDKLPTEILMKILDYVDGQNLVKCRRLSSRWNEICCLFLQQKPKNNPDSNLVVQLNASYDEGYNLVCRTGIKTGSLEAFLDCFFPPQAEKLFDGPRPHSFQFSWFIVQDFYLFNESQMVQFILCCGHQIKYLFLDIKEQDIQNFEIFWKLLLRFAPNIEHLAIEGDHWLSKVKLRYSDSEYLNNNEEDNLEAQNQQTESLSSSFLKNLKIVQVERNQGFGKFNRFLKDLLDNSPNVKEVSCCGSKSGCNRELIELVVWRRVGKAHLLKNMELRPDSQRTFSAASLMKTLQLEYLRADCDIYANSVETKTSTTNYIYHAIKSSQNTLTSLSLNKLIIESMNRCLKDISSLPNLRQLHLEDSRETEILLERFSQLSPKITSLKLDGKYCCHFSAVAPIIWTEFKGLEFLKISLDVDDEGRHPSIIDSKFSGYSVESIGRIQAKLEKGISLEEARRGEPQNPSILNLKNLRELELEFELFVLGRKSHNLDDELKNSLFLKMLPNHLIGKPLLISNIEDWDY